MRDLNHISHDAVALYIKGLEAKGYSKQEIAAKLRNIDRFMQWAYDKDHLHYSRYQQLKDEIAKYSQIFASSAGFSPAEDQSRAVSSTWASPINGRAPPVESTKDRQDGHIVDVKPEGQHTIRQYGDNYGIQSSLINILVSIPLINKLPYLQKATKQAVIPVLGPTSAWPQQEEKNEDDSSTSLLTYIQQRPAFIIGGFMTLLVLSLLSYGIYDRFFQTTETTQAYPATPTFTSTRILSFQGRLTDNLGNPITASTNMRFRLYDASSGGSTLYDSGTCAITPDQDGVHNVLIGSDCGSGIDSSIFTENTEVWLGVTVGSDSEMTPRQQVANVPYALNAETLQGLPPGTSASSVAYINQGGDLLIGAASPQIGSTYASQTFVVSSANALTLQSASTGDITLLASGSGQLVLQASGDTDDYIYIATDTNNAQVLFEGYTANDPGIRLNSSTNQLEYRDENASGWTTFDSTSTNYWQLNSNVLAPGGDATVSDRLVLGGNTSTNHQFDVSGAITGKALVLLDEEGDQNILTASSSGTTRFNLTNAGQVELKADGSTAGITIGAGDDIALYHDGTDSILTTSTGDWNITATDDFIFTDNQVTNIQLSDVDSSLPNSNTGIVDAINDAYNAATGVSGGLWTDSGTTTYLTTTTDELVLGGSTPLSTAKFSIDGDADQIQLIVQGNSTQTNSLAVFENSAGTDVFTIANTGDLATAGDIAVNGGDVTSSAGTVNLFNSTPTTLNIGGAATTVELGAATGTTSINNNLTIDGNTTIGNASGDTLTANAATWTFANDTSVVLSGGVNGLNFDSNTLSIDATNDRLGIGTAAPDAAWVDIAAATTSKAQINFTSSAATDVSSPTSGDIWWNGTQLYFYNGSSNINLLNPGGNVAWSSITDPAANLTLAMAEYSTDFNWDSTANDNFFTLNLDNNGGTAGNDYLLTLTNAVSSQTTGDLNTEALLLLDQADTTVSGTTAVDDALLITNSGGSTLTDAIQIGTGSQAIGTGINFGSTGITTDINLQNGETIDNNTDGTITMTGAIAVTGTSDFQDSIGDSTGDLTVNDNFVVTGTSDLQGNVANSTGNLVLADIVDIGSATTGLNITTAGLITDSDGNVVIGDTVDLGSATTGINITTAGAISDSDGNVAINDTVNVTGDITATGDVAVNGGDITSSAATVNIFNATPTTLNIGGAATTIELGAATGTTSVNNALTIDGNTTLGNASGDSVTSNAATWTFANDTSVVLSGGVNGLNFDSNTLSIDATNDRIGIGTAAPDAAWVDIAAATTSKAQLNLTSSVGTDVSSPNSGDLWWNGTQLYFYNGSTNTNLLDTGGGGAWSDLTDPTSDLSLDMAEYRTGLSWNTAATSAARDFFELDITNDATTDGGTQNLFALTNSNDGGSSTGQTESLLYIDNQDTNEAVTAAINIVDSGGGGFTADLNLQNGETIDNATDGTITMTGAIAVTGTSDLQGDVANSTGNLVLADTVDIGSASTGINITTAGAISDSDGNVAINDTVDVTGDITATGDLAVNGDDITSDGNLTLNATGYTRIGDTATPGSANGDDDLFVEGDIELDGVLYLDGTLDTTFTAGSIVFAGASGVLAEDNTNFFWDDTNNKLSIGSAAPVGKLDVTGAITGKALSIFNETGDQAILTASASGTERFTVENNGNVTFNPSAFGSAITLYDADTTLPNSNTGIVDAINDAYTAALGGGGGLWTDSATTTYLTTTTDDLVLGGSSPLSSGKFSIDGDTDQIQLIVQGNSTQTTSLAVFENSAGTDQFTISNTGDIVATGDLAVNGGDVTSSASIVNLFNATPTTLNIGGAATTIELGAASGTTSVNNALTIDGNTTLGNASGDSVTSNAATWTFANDTAIALSGGVDGLNFDSNTLSIDATGNKVGIGTAAPTGKLHVEGAVTGKALAIFNETGDQDILVASAGGTTRFRVANDGAIYGSYWVDISNNTYGLDPAGTTNFGNNSLRITGGALLAEDSGSVGIGLSSVTGALQVAGDEVRIGDAGTPGFATADGDLYVEDALEVDGILYTDGGIDTAFTQGSVVFAGASGVLAEDNAGFFWDDSANELGLGTNSPAAALDVLDTTEQLRLSYDASNTTSFTVSSGGDLTLAPSGDNLAINAGTTITADLNDTGGIGILGNLTFTGSSSNRTGTSLDYTNTGTLSGTMNGLALSATNSGSAGTLNGIYNYTYSAWDATSTTTVRGQYNETVAEGTGVTTAIGTLSYLSNQLNTPTTISNIVAQTAADPTSTTATLNGILIDTSLSSGGTVTNGYGLNIESLSNSGTFTDIYGIYVGDQAAGTISDDAYGIYVANQSGATGDDIGIVIEDADLYSLQLASTDADAASGITFGTDTNLYRSASNTLHTDDAFDVDGALTVGSAAQFQVDSSGNITTTGDLAVNGGDLTSSAATFNLLNATPTTINFGGAATTVEIGATTGTTSINNALTVDGNTTLGNASGDTVTSNAASWSFANATNFDLATSTTALTFETDLLALDTSNDGVDITSGATTTDIFDITGNSLTTGTLIDANFNALTSGTGLSLASTSTALTTGSLATIDWSPGSSTTATGDLFSINIGTNGNVDTLFNVTDTGSSLFKVTESGIESSVPASFTSAGDVSFAYDAIFTNQTSSQIESYGPFSIIAGEASESNDLTLTTYNSGDIVLAAGGSTSGTGTISFYDSNIKGASVTTAIPFADSSTDINTFRTNFTNENIIDAINETYTAATSGSSPWTDGGSYLYPTAGEVLGNSASAGANKIAGLYLGDDDLAVFGADNDFQLTYDETTDNALELGDGTNTFLSIVDGGTTASFTFTGNLLPAADDTYDLGSNSARWQDLYLGPQTLHIGTSTTDEGTLSYTTSSNTLTMTNNYGDTTFTSSSDGFNFVLGGGAGDDLIVDTTTLVVESDTDSVGIGTAAPNGKFSVTGAKTGKALAIFNETGDQNIIVASSSGVAKFAVGNNGNVSFLDSHGVFAVGSQDSMVHNSGFEADLDGNGIPDGWTSSGTISQESTTVNQGSYALTVGTNQTATSRCFPTGATGLSAYAVRLQARLDIFPIGANQLTTAAYAYTTKANCESDSGIQIFGTNSTLTTSWQEIAASAGFSTTRTWARIKIINNSSTEQLHIDGLRVVNSTQTDGLDLAETYPVHPDDNIEAGEIVAFGAGELTQDVPAIRRSNGKDDQDIFGVVATQPGLVLDDNGNYPKAKVALVGRVPVQVTSENGPIRIGDAITASSLPGIGMRSTKPGRVIGRAMTEWDNSNPSEIGSIIVFVEPGYDAGYILTETKKLIKDAQKAIVADSIKVKNLVASSIKATTATIDNLIVNRFTAQEAVITDADIERLNAEAIKAQEIEAERLAAEEAEIEKLTSSDITSGSLSAESAEISGTLVADNIDSQNVRDLRDRLEKLAAEQSDVVIDSETLESEVSEIQEYITQLTNQETPEEIADTEAYQIVDENIALDPGTTESILGNSITTANLESLMVTGEASMTTLAVADAFSAGEIFIKDNSLISLNNELKLAALEKIDLMNGGVIITADGSITAKGEVIAQKGVRSNSLRALEDGDDISVILDQREESTFSLTDPSATDTRITNSEFNIQNTSGQKVASIDAEGSARFRDLSLDKYTEATTSAVVIAASDNYKQNGIYTPAIKTNAAASGNGILPEGENDIIVYNDSITKDTVVNLTATSSSRNKALYVDKIESCEDSDTEECTPYFRVALDDDVDIDVTFNWLIVN